MKVTESNLDELKLLINKKVWLMMKSKARYIGTLRHINRKKGKITVHGLTVIGDSSVFITSNVRDFKIEKIELIHEYSWEAELG